MPYTSQEELTDRYGAAVLERLTDRADPPAGSIDTDVIAQALEDTDALIDGYVAVKYQLPMSPVPPLIRTLATHIAIYTLHVYEPDPKIKADYEAAIKSLKSIADGTIRLATAGVDADQVDGGGVRATDRERPMTPETLKGFI